MRIEIWKTVKSKSNSNDGFDIIEEKLLTLGEERSVELCLRIIKIMKSQTLKSINEATANYLELLENKEQDTLFGEIPDDYQELYDIRQRNEDSAPDGCVKLVNQTLEFMDNNLNVLITTKYFLKVFAD